MNKFKKYCPTVWVAECEEEHEKGDIIQPSNENALNVLTLLIAHTADINRF